MGMRICSCIKRILEIFLNQRNFVVLTGIVSLVSLAFAYTAQYAFNVNPCILCYYERYVYWALVALAAIMLIVQVKSPSLPTKVRQECVLFSLLGVILLAGLVLAAYHLGVEWHWWEGTSACRGISQRASSLEEMRQLINNQAPSRCDQPNWMIFGVSATIWNVLWYLGFLFFWIVSCFGCCAESKN
jgi:disulfide bond formation protein DsbB